MSTVNVGPHPGLLGRHEEQRVLRGVVAGALTGRGGALVLRGEAGIGKTTLLSDLEASSPACRVVRVTGVESEMELAFAGLQQLCAPWAERAEALPAPQASALATAFGVREGPPPERFLVGLAVLSLLSEVAAEQPLLCLIDDAQWLDQVSVHTLAFVARRLARECIAMVIAVRAPEAPAAWRGVPEVVVEGLQREASRSLLAAVLPGPVDDRVRARVLDEACGNPLALRELASGPPARFEGGFALPDRTPVEGRIERQFLQRVLSLPADSRVLLLTAAAEPTGDLSLLRRAADLLGFTLAAAVPAQESGLISFDLGVRFSHPLVRSAVYASAAPADRQRVHAALAEATSAESDPDRQAWHRAHASTGLDEEVATSLERCADRARARGGAAAAAAFLDKSAALTPDPRLRTSRALAAAQAMMDAADPAAALRLIGSVELGPSDPLERAKAARLRAQIGFTQHRGGASVRALLSAAELLRPLDARLAREAYLEALAAAIFSGRLTGAPGARETAAQAAREAPPQERPPRPLDLVLDGVVTRFTAGYGRALEPLRTALDALTECPARTGADVMGWLWLACPVAPEPLASEVWDYEAWRMLADRSIHLARDSGALGVLPVALSYRAGVHVHAGELDVAGALLAESDSLSRAAGATPLRYASLMLLAWRGDEQEALPQIRSAEADAHSRGEGRVLGLSGYATAVLHNGLGHYQEALAAAVKALEYDDLGFYGWSLVELIEAAARSGAEELGREWLPRLEERTLTAGTDWALGVLAGCRALLGTGPAAEADYLSALAHLGRTPVRTQAARTHLLYGEWLRREGRRREAAEQLQIAWSELDRMGAHAFADRALRELGGAGLHPRRGTNGRIEQLSAQEAQIARLAADGLTNPQIGEQLFLSRHTVEWHLRKVYTTLGVHSRRELPDLLGRAVGDDQPLEVGG